MNIHDVTELIWHFIGYMHFDDDFSKSHIEYEHATSRHMLDDEQPQATEAASSSTDLTMDPVAAVRIVSFLDPTPVAFDLPYGADHHYATPGVHSGPTAHTSHLPHFGAIDGGSAFSLYHIHRGDFDPAPRQTLFDLRQNNLLDDRDHFQSDPHWTGVLPELQQTHPLTELVASAKSVVPSELGPLSGGSSQLAVDYAHQLKATEEAQAPSAPESQSQPTADLPPSVEPGLYVNGIQLAADESFPNHPAVTPPEMPEPTNGPTGDLGITTQAAETGSNIAFNGAVIDDANGACGTRIVLGDKVCANVIVQANVYSDDDTIKAAGPDHGTLLSGDNLADNFAKLTTHEFDDAPTATSGLPLRVDVIDGDFFDVRALFQRNAMLDGDVVTQTSSDHYSLVKSGDNESVNFGAVADFDFTNYYDAIVIGGTYYNINGIVQLNMLQDNDAVSIGGSGGGSGTVYSGGNSLLNSAQILHYGTAETKPLQDGMETLDKMLSAGSSSAPASWGLTDGGDGHIDVLYVKGDYFDINVLWQVNVMSDNDVVVLDAGGATTATQVASTGANTLQNEAVIIDVGAMYSEHIGGHTYDGSTLIQANLIESDNDAVIHDTTTLVPELIAFTDHDDTTAHDPSNISHPTTPVDHILGNMMG